MIKILKIHNRTAIFCDVRIKRNADLMVYIIKALLEQTLIHVLSRAAFLQGHSHTVQDTHVYPDRKSRDPCPKLRGLFLK